VRYFSIGSLKVSRKAVTSVERRGVALCRALGLPVALLPWLAALLVR
jgi:hypothetical protein